MGKNIASHTSAMMATAAVASMITLSSILAVTSPAIASSARGYSARHAVVAAASARMAPMSDTNWG